MGRYTCVRFLSRMDPDDNVGFLSSGNGYRYSSSITFGIKAIWYLGRSGRYSSGTVGGIFSRSQRINELEFRFTYGL